MANGGLFLDKPDNTFEFRSTMKISARSSILESTDAANSLMDAVLESRATLFPDLSPGSLDILGGNSLLGVTNLDTSDGSLIEAFSHKAGDAGYAGSGDATGGRGGNGLVSSGVSLSTLANILCRSPAKVRRVCTPAAGAKGGDANSGAGGNSDGGSVIHNGRPGITLISLFSGTSPQISPMRTHR
ncbi:hypothetical protein FRC03_008406 [Tulasnella sp. 419]|nr:hypothetical protein FRC03_008406 [Tulasnella sp. 419]